MIIITLCVEWVCVCVLIIVMLIQVHVGVCYHLLECMRVCVCARVRVRLLHIKGGDANLKSFPDTRR